MRRLVYRSQSLIVADPMARDLIAEQAAPLNIVAEITGLLWSDASSFVQVLEGSSQSVDGTMGRIQRDLRHHRIEIVSFQAITARLFGSWAMASVGSPEEWADKSSFLEGEMSPAQIMAAAQLIDTFQTIGGPRS
jgi:hypothetical protein